MRKLNNSGVCKTRTGYLRMADADGKMRMGKCGWGNADRKVRMEKSIKKWRLKIDASIVLCVGKVPSLDCERSLDVVGM